MIGRPMIHLFTYKFKVEELLGPVSPSDEGHGGQGCGGGLGARTSILHKYIQEYTSYYEVCGVFHVKTFSSTE